MVFPQPWLIYNYHPLPGASEGGYNPFSTVGLPLFGKEVSGTPDFKILVRVETDLFWLRNTYEIKTLIHSGILTCIKGPSQDLDLV